MCVCKGPFVTLIGAFAVFFAAGCGNNDTNPLTSDFGTFPDLNAAADAIAAVEANTIDAELLALSESIEFTEDNPETPPTERPRPRLDRLQEALGLTDDQVAQIEAIINDTRVSLQRIREQVRDGSLTREEAREQIRALHEDQRSRIEAVLTEEQLAQWEALREQHGRQFHRPPLQRFLQLTDEQAAQLEAIMHSTWEQLHAIRDQVEAGTLAPEEARAQIRALREAEREQIASILDEDQLRRFSRLMRHHRFRGGSGLRG